MTVVWEDVSTVLLDMDGTLLDLAFDNFFWQELVPSAYAGAAGLAADDAREYVFALYRDRAGTLDWYCLDHWSAELSLDIDALKRAHLDRVAFLPGAREFLDALAARGLPRILATNAHGRTLELKLEQTGLDAHLDAVHSSHCFGAAKEQQAFWRRFQEAVGFEPSRTLFVDDNPHVLDAARRFGIGQTVIVTQPDSTLPPQAPAGGAPAVRGVGELVKGLLAR